MDTLGKIFNSASLRTAICGTAFALGGAATLIGLKSVFETGIDAGSATILPTMLLTGLGYMGLRAEYGPAQTPP